MSILTTLWGATESFNEKKGALKWSISNGNKTMMHKSRKGSKSARGWEERT